MKKEIVLRETKRYAFMVLACLCYSLSIEAFLIPNKIVAGGVSGAASLINILTGLPAGLFIALLNLPILICGLKMMGWKFILRCFITTVSLSITTEIWSFVLSFIDNFAGFTSDPILAALYGGVLQGIGIGLFIKYETSSGGTELLGRLTHNLIPFATIATHVALFDGLVVLLGAIFLSSLENILYALILIFVSAKVSDIIVLGLAKAKLCYIITTKGEEIGDFLISHSPRGVTLMNGEGMYSKTSKDVLLTCVKSTQIVSLKASVKAIDENAFVIVCEANEVYGKGFHQI
jgi:uncharacterized membrane-anchored protein YitT (DUF2179 family)